MLRRFAHGTVEDFVLCHEADLFACGTLRARSTMRSIRFHPENNHAASMKRVNKPMPAPSQPVKASRNFSRRSHKLDRRLARCYFGDNVWFTRLNSASKFPSVFSDSFGKN
jgi:hypothetical protein